MNVLQSNANYNSMLSERLKAEDELREQLKADMQKAVENERNRAKKNLDSVTDQLEKSHKKDMDEAKAKKTELEVACRSLTVDLEELKMQFRGSKEKILGEEQARKKLKEKIEELENRNKDDRNILESQIQSWRSKKASSDSDLEMARGVISQLTAQVQDHEQHINRKEGEMREMEKTVRELQREMERQEARNSEAVSMRERQLTEIKSKIISSEATHRQLESEIEDERRRNEEAQEDIKDLKKRLETEKKHADDLTRSRTANDKQWLKRIEDANMEMQKLRTSLQTELEQNRASWHASSASMRTEFEEQVRKARHEESRRSMEQIDALKGEFEREKEKLRMEHSRQVKVRIMYTKNG